MPFTRSILFLLRHRNLISNTARTTPTNPPTEPPIAAACGVDNKGDGGVDDEDAVGVGRRKLSAATDRADATDKADRKAEGKGIEVGFASTAADWLAAVTVMSSDALIVSVGVVVVRRVALLFVVDVDDVAVVRNVGSLGKTVTTALLLNSPHENPNHMQDVPLGQQSAPHGDSPNLSLHWT